MGVLGGVGGCELGLLWGVDELVPKRAAESIPVEAGMGEADLLLSSPGGPFESAIENDTVIDIAMLEIGPDTGSWKKRT